MTARSRESRLNSAFVTLADTLADDYDPADLLHTLAAECEAIFDVQAVGLLLADANGTLQLVASTSEQAELVDIMQLDAGAGPGVQSFETGEVVSVSDIEKEGGEWPGFRAAALEHGFLAIDVIPMKLRGDVIGSLVLLSANTGALDALDVQAARALTDVATIGILQERVSRERRNTAEQLQHALDARILIEQAKGMVSILGSLDMDEAKTLMRDYARSRSIRLHDVAASILDRSLDVTTILSERASA
jgi:GAF domain-containing protein